MPFRNKIQPIDANGAVVEKPQVPKSRLKRLFERQFSLKNFAGGDPSLSKGNAEEFEPNSVCLRNMVQNYIDDPNYGKPQRCVSRNCFNGSSSDSSDDEESSYREALGRVKNLVLCTNTSEETLVEKATEIVEREDKCKRKEEDLPLKTVVDGLVALGYDAAICKSRWEKSKKTACPAGEYEYLDVMVGGERVLIDIDFKSKFEIARPTKTYKSISQTLPYIFVGQVDRLKKIVVVVSEAATKSLKKKGLHMPPWRKADFVLTKWVSTYVRTNQSQGETNGDDGAEA